MLGQLAFACYLFNEMAGYDESLHEFRDEVGDELDLSNLASGRALLHWLNHWGCRHLATGSHEVAARRLADWYAQNRDRLPGANCRLVSCPHAKLALAAELFDGLSKLVVGRRRHGSVPQDVTLAPTATAKTLFALRPHCLVAWDVAMRQAFGHNGSGESYVVYLKEVQEKLRTIEEQCQIHDIDLDALPAKLGRQRSTAAQLIDEYHWITVTRGVKPPTAGTLRHWLAWN